MDTREDNSGKTAYPYLERVKAFAEEVYQEEMAELKKKNPNSAPAHATTFDVRDSIRSSINRQTLFDNRSREVKLAACDLEDSLDPLHSFAMILKSHHDEIQADDAGKVLGALLHNVYDKTGGFPSMAKGM